MESLSNLEEARDNLKFTVGKICEEYEAELNCKLTGTFKAGLAELTLSHLESVVSDLELFARHAKRSIINPDDFKLLVRRNESMFDKLDQLSTQKKKPN